MLYQLARQPRFSIADPEQNTLFWGCHQEWYPCQWQKMAGCGPATVSTMLLYLLKNFYRDESFPISRKDCLSLMEDVWESVTPSRNGIPTTALLQSKIHLWMERKGLFCHFNQLDISLESLPPLCSITSFLKTSLEKDLPVAFLNLDAGKEPVLDNWHWVTIISLDCPSSSEAYIQFLDEGMVKKADLSLWLSTTRKGGGFLSFSIL